MAKMKGELGVKRTYTPGEEDSQQVESQVPVGQRSQIVESLPHRQKDEIRRQALRNDIERGLAEVADVNSVVSREWNNTETEAWPKA